jgi:hypothetical protein
MPFKGVNWDQPLSCNGRRQPLEIHGACVPGGVKDLERNVASVTFRFQPQPGAVP